MACTVRPVRTRRELRRFISFPYHHYAGSPYWVPPLRMEQREILNPRKNPFFEHGRMQLYLAVDADNRVVGRIAGIFNGEHLRMHQDQAGFFGFFECEEKYETAVVLLDAAAAWVRSQGLSIMRGPTNPTLNDSSGLLVDGFDRVPSILMTYNYPYYEEFLTRWGFERVMRLWAYYIHRKHVQFDRLRRGANIVHRRNPGLSLRTLDMSRYEQDVQIVRDIYNDAWKNNWGFVPVTDAEFSHLAASMKQIVDPRVCFFVLLNGVPVGFTISLPNINPALQRLPNGRLLPFGLAKLLILTKFAGVSELRMPLMGVRRQYQRRAFDVLPVLETIEKGPQYGYQACESSWILDSNHIQKNLLTSIGTAIDKEYALLEAALD
ncbi:MAG: hypothetical protein OXM02_07480 [Bacteroidota bacterium]|nr:hypothetical protein [Bacteroidota bacterium]MDE2955447.1 hypothetical protein [Bacteroidota bacterium]